MIRKFNFFVIIVSLLIFFVRPAVAAEEPVFYPKLLITTIENQGDLVNSLNAEADKADFNTVAGVTAFRAILIDDKKQLEKNLAFFRSPAPPDTPLEVQKTADLAASGTDNLVRGLALQIEGYTKADIKIVDAGLAIINTGVTDLNSGTKEFDVWYKATYNQGPQSPSSVVVSKSRDFGLGFLFSKTLYFGAPLLIVFIYLLIVGFILHAIFRSRLKQLVSGKTDGTDFRGTAFYGIHLVILLPYLYLLLIFSVLLIADFAVGGAVLLIGAKQIPIFLPFALVIVVFSSLWGIFQGLFGRKQRNNLGISFSRTEQPKLWEMCDQVASEVGTAGADEIILSPTAGIGVNLSGGLFSLLLGRTKRVLTIGMGAIPTLTVSQLKAILAHEFGHFSNRDTAWNSLTFTMAASLDNTLARIPTPWHKSSTITINIVAAFNPALWVLYGYRLLFRIVTGGFSRMREVFADKTAIGLYGYNNFANGLTKIVRNDYAFSKHFTPDILQKLVKENMVYDNVFATMEKAQRSISSEVIAEIDAEVFDKEKASLFDSHPLLRERMAYAKHFEVKAKHETNDADIKTIFVNWDEVSTRLSNFYTYYLAVITGNKRLVDPNMCNKCGQQYDKEVLAQNGLCPKCNEKAKSKVEEVAVDKSSLK